jgi:hypothetical protein
MQGQIKGLKDFAEGCVSLKQQVARAIRETMSFFPAVESSVTKLAGIQTNLQSKQPAVVVVLAVQSTCGMPYIPPCLFVHSILPSYVSNSILVDFDLKRAFKQLNHVCFVEFQQYFGERGIELSL